MTSMSTTWAPWMITEVSPHKIQGEKAKSVVRIVSNITNTTLLKDTPDNHFAPFPVGHTMFIRCVGTQEMEKRVVVRKRKNLQISRHVSATGKGEQTF